MNPDTAAKVSELQLNVNLMWTLLCSFLVMFMQAGFALIETGLTRAKNVGHTMAMNLLVYPLGVLGFWAVGFGLQMGGVGSLASFGGDATLSREFTLHLFDRDWGLWGQSGFFLPPSALTPAVATLFLFQLVFMDTAATIPTGAGAERWKFTSFLLFSLAMSTFIYPIYANWVWGGGWLSALGRSFGLGHGHVDFAGCSVVHMTGGVAALLVARNLGPRRDKYSPSGTPRPIPGHSIPLVVLGTFVLAFGWFGFNAGSTLAATDTRIAVIALNTMLASASGAVAAFVYTTKRFGKPDVSMLCNGMLGGLVAITASCAFVSSLAAVLIGAIAGVLVIASALYVEQTLKVDDPVGAISVHLVAGSFGILCVGLFPDGSYGDGLNGVAGGVRGLFWGDGGQLVAACIGIAANVVWVGLAASVSLVFIDKWVGNRSTPGDELDGLDVAEMGGPGYASDDLNLIAVERLRPAPAPAPLQARPSRL